MARSKYIQFGKPLDDNTGIGNKIALSIIVVGLLVGGVAYMGKHVAWWFTPAFKARSVTNQFFSDALQGKPQAAYALTTPVMQQINTYTAFTDNLSHLQNPNAQVRPTAYNVKAKQAVVVVGTLTDTKTKEVKLFGITIVKTDSGQEKVDAVTVVDDGVETAAARAQHLSQLASGLGR